MVTCGSPDVDQFSKTSSQKVVFVAWFIQKLQIVIAISIYTIYIYIYTEVPADRIETFSSDFKKKLVDFTLLGKEFNRQNIIHNYNILSAGAMVFTRDSCVFEQILVKLSNIKQHLISFNMFLHILILVYYIKLVLPLRLIIFHLQDSHIYIYIDTRFLFGC